jgi:hypothetical protein
MSKNYIVEDVSRSYLLSKYIKKRKKKKEREEINYVELIMPLSELITLN